MSNFDYKKYLAEGRIHLSEDEEQGTMSNIEVYTATFDNDFGTFIDDFASTVGVDNNVEMDQGRISTRPGDFNAWDEFGYEEHWNSIPDGSYFKIEGNTPGMVDYPSLKDYTFVRKGNVIKGELVTLKRDLAEGKLVKEGVWNLPTEDEIIEFVAHVEDMKDKFYHIGSDDVFNGLDQAIIAAKDLAMNRTYVEDPSNPLGEPGSLNEFEVGDTVVFKGMAKDGEKMTVVGKRKMFAVKDNGRNLIAIKVELPDGTKSEYDETQLTKFSR
jgi:hypothetical protein